MKRYLLTILSFLLLTGTISNATVRYVSKTGSSTPPYTSWATAADSIMKCIDICAFGDTIYVANGIYKERVDMIPGLSLIGAGMDSCVIDTRDLATTTSFIAVEVEDTCLLKGFKVLVANNTELGGGIGGSAFNSSITLNRITSAKYGIYLGSNTTIYKNTLDQISSGLYLFNSNAIARSNTISTDPNSQSVIVAGIHIEAFDFSYTPVIDSNYINAEGSTFRPSNGIYKSFGAKPTITNNIIILNGPQDSGMRLSSSDSGRVFNNLIIAESGRWGIFNIAIQYLQLYNNYITGNFENQQLSYYVVYIGPDNVVKNNVVTGGERGVGAWGTENLVFQYNDVWNNDVNYSGFPPDSTNLTVDPMVVNDDTTQGELDFHLQMFSPLIDAGDPTVLDKDSTRSDIGLYGGPFGESYIYLDLPPRPPVNLTAEVDSNKLTLMWNKNTEADFNHYNLYRDTVANFTIDTTKLVASLQDTFYLHTIPAGAESLYFKLTAVDNQGNESNPSEELALIVTSLSEEPQIVSNYQLYQNYPNPFNPSTKIGYKLKERGYVKLYVYDIRGELVEVLVNQTQEAGYYEVTFSGETKEGRLETLASGVYIYQIMVKSDNDIPVFSDIRKMVYLK